MLIENINLPVPQGVVLQVSDSELDPGHVAPPFEGGGLLQSLLRA